MTVRSTQYLIIENGSLKLLSEQFLKFVCRRMLWQLSWVAKTWTMQWTGCERWRLPNTSCLRCWVRWSSAHWRAQMRTESMSALWSTHSRWRVWSRGRALCRFVYTLHLVKFTLTAFWLKRGLIVSSNDIFLQAFLSVLDQCPKIELDVPLVKSYLAQFAARAIIAELVSMAELAHPLENGTHFPLFLLCLQQTAKMKDREWLTDLFQQSKVSMQKMLPGMCLFPPCMVILACVLNLRSLKLKD